MVADKFEVSFHQHSVDREGPLAPDLPFAKNRQYTSAVPGLASPKDQELLHSDSMNVRLFACLLPVLLLQAEAGMAQEDGLARVKERELERVRERISELKERMDDRAAERDQITADLQAAEVLISEQRIQLSELERKRVFSEKKIAELEAQAKAREADLGRETDQLAAQVRAAYTTGRQERVKLLLNQHDPALLGRMLAYYRYLSEHRGQNIEAVNRHLAELAGLHSEAAGERDRLAALAMARQDELARLDATQAERRQLLAALKAKIEEEGAEIERLAAEEKDLTRLIAELTSILSDYPITSDAPFTDLKGGLTWPVAGTLLHDFGQPRAGGTLKWNGVVLAAPRGREVRAVYHGRVVFADWLAGLGLLVIVDHGEGYMTLYGYNETTLKSAGDWVAPGDVIATVGDSGGQSRASLYFEIRQGAKPVDPRGWITRKPRSGG
jgi:septal ring factor EnvC (AmiA/AmiB activator)